MLHRQCKYFNQRQHQNLVGVPAVEGVYRQLGDSNSQWHNKKFKKVPVGGSASWGKYQLGEVLVGGLVPVGGQKFNPWMDDFFPILILNKIYENITKVSHSTKLR